MEGLLGVKNAAKFLGFSKAKLYDMASKGEVPCFKLGGKWKFDPTALKKWWEEESLIQERANKGK